MYGLIVTLYAKTASFRDPGAQLYHETMPLPPPSTITESQERLWVFLLRMHWLL